MASCEALHPPSASPRAEIRRAGARTSISLPALINLLGQVHRANLKNLSEHGAMIKTDARLLRDDELLFRCGAIEVRAKVVWQTGAHAGLEFRTLVPFKDIREQLLRAGFLEDRRNARLLIADNS